MSETPPSGSPSYGSAIRVAQIIHWLHGSPIGISQAELVARLGISKRTLARYIQTLKDCFFDDDGEPLLEVTRPENGGRLRFRRRSEKVEGSAYELMSLYLALDLMTFLEGTFIMDGAQELLDRLQDRLRKEHGHQTNLMLKDFHKKFFHHSEAPKDYSHLNELLGELVKALVLQKQVEITYQSPGNPEKIHQIWPLSLLMYKRGLYLVARRPSDGLTKMRDITFAVERIKFVKLMTSGFFYPQDYYPEERFQNCFGLVQFSEAVDIRLRFAPTVAQNVVSRRWHQSQQNSWLESGEVEVAFCLETGEEFIAWLLGFGHFVKVLKPAELAERIKQRLQHALAQYEPMGG